MPKGACLHAVPANLHRAPFAGAVLGPIVKGPLASIIGTGLQPAPYPFVRGPHHGGKDAAKGRRYTRRFWRERRDAVLIETDPKTHALDDTVEFADAGRCDRFTIVG